MVHRKSELNKESLCACDGVGNTHLVHLALPAAFWEHGCGLNEGPAMTAPESNRKWFQFSLRLLLLVVVAGNVFWWSYRAYWKQLELNDSLAHSLAQENEAHTRLALLASEFRAEAKASFEMAEEQRRIAEQSKYKARIKALKRLRQQQLWMEQARQKAEDDAQIANEFAKELEARFKKQNASIAALKARLKACGCADE